METTREVTASITFVAFDISASVTLGSCYTVTVTNLGDPNNPGLCGLLDAQKYNTNPYSIIDRAGILGIAEGQTGTFQFTSNAATEFLEFQVQGSSGKLGCRFSYSIRDTNTLICVG